MKIKNPNYKFVNVQDDSSSYVVDIPTKNELDSIKQGDLVKVILPGERFWAKVLAIRKRIGGVVTNRLVNAEKFGVDYGDIVLFDKACVLEIKKGSGEVGTQQALNLP